MKSERYTILMSIYAREKPAFFLAAMESIRNQTLPPDEIVLVCDGALTKELETAIAQAAIRFHDQLKIIRLENHVGLGAALNEGLKACHNEYVARMDTDDIACPDRCERQLSYMLQNNLSLCSGTIAEFYDDPNRITSLRRLPEGHDALVQFAKRRNPMNHPCTMFQKTSVEAVGGYRNMMLFEDYDLWVRMIQNGAKLGNCPWVLTLMRTGAGMYGRRGGRDYCRCIFRFFDSLYKNKFITRREFLENVMLRCAVSLTPVRLRSLFYRNVLREKI